LALHNQPDKWDNHDPDVRGQWFSPFTEEEDMFPGRLVSLACIFSIVLVIAACSSDSSNRPSQPDDSIEVDLSKFPDTGDPVSNHTVLSDQWASIGILFSAMPAGVNPVKENFGTDTAHIFFSPDVQHAIAVFRFVDPGTTDPVDATAFELRPWFSPGESAELVGLDEGGMEVAIDAVTPDDIGDESQSLEMSIRGSFRVVEWRTHGNPGIAAHSLAFEL
jgi:hypothetical protein